MKPLAPPTSRAEQAYHAILDEICEGALPAGTHLVQEQLAERLGVSRQPIQQAMALLRADGSVEEAGGRGLRVAPLDMRMMRHRYEIRAALDGLAARLAARRAASSPAIAADIEKRGGALIDAGRAAVAAGAVKRMIRHDVDLHGLLYECSGNPLLAAAAEPHWRFLRRVMGEVLRHAEPPEEIWRQHAEILDAVVRGDAAAAERLAAAHIADAADLLEDAVGGGADQVRP